MNRFTVLALGLVLALVSAPGLATPVAVRFNWSNCPEGFLFNGSGLPAAPFRSDQW